MDKRTAVARAQHRLSVGLNAALVVLPAAVGVGGARTTRARQRLGNHRLRRRSAARLCFLSLLLIRRQRPPSARVASDRRGRIRVRGRGAHGHGLSRRACCDGARVAGRRGSRRASAQRVAAAALRRQADARAERQRHRSRYVWPLLTWRRDPCHCQKPRRYSQPSGSRHCAASCCACASCCSAMVAPVEPQFAACSCVVLHN